MDVLSLESSLNDNGMQIQSPNSCADISESVGPPDLDGLFGIDDEASLWPVDDVTASASDVSQVYKLLSNEPNSQSNQVPHWDGMSGQPTCEKMPARTLNVSRRRQGHRKAAFPEGVPYYTGVRMRGPGRWTAEIKDLKSNVRRWLGTHSTAEGAALAYDLAIQEIRGPLARTNFGPHTAKPSVARPRNRYKRARVAQQSSQPPLPPCVESDSRTGTPKQIRVPAFDTRPTKTPPPVFSVQSLWEQTASQKERVAEVSYLVPEFLTSRAATSPPVPRMFNSCALPLVYPGEGASGSMSPTLVDDILFQPSPDTYAEAAYSEAMTKNSEFDQVPQFADAETSPFDMFTSPPRPCLPASYTPTPTLTPAPRPSFQRPQPLKIRIDPLSPPARRIPSPTRSELSYNLSPYPNHATASPSTQTSTPTAYPTPRDLHASLLSPLAFTAFRESRAVAESTSAGKEVKWGFEMQVSRFPGWQWRDEADSAR